MKFNTFWLKDELRSFSTTLLSFLIIDGSLQLMAVYNGNFSQEALLALGVAVGRSAIKALLTLAMPSLFPHRSS